MWFLIFLFLFVMCAAMAIDLGRVYLAGNFLQDVADSAAHAAATAANPNNPTTLNSSQARARANAIVTETAKAGGPVDNLRRVGNPKVQGGNVDVEVAGDIRAPFLGFFLENGKITLTRSATASTCFADGGGGTRGPDYRGTRTCTRPDGVVRLP